MATYTPSQLYGTGSLNETLSGAKTFTFSNPSSSAYFTLEGIRNSDGFYDSTSNIVAEGTYTSFDGDFDRIQNISSSLITSSYIFSMVIPRGNGSFIFTPSPAVAINTAYLKGTGEYTLVIS